MSTPMASRTSAKTTAKKRATETTKQPASEAERVAAGNHGVASALASDYDAAAGAADELLVVAGKGGRGRSAAALFLWLLAGNVFAEDGDDISDEIDDAAEYARLRARKALMKA